MTNPPDAADLAPAAIVLVLAALCGAVAAWIAVIVFALWMFEVWVAPEIDDEPEPEDPERTDP